MWAICKCGRYEEEKSHEGKDKVLKKTLQGPSGPVIMNT